MAKERNYCGCCGREINEWDVWCDDCEKHVLSSRELTEKAREMPSRILRIVPLNQRTYFAQHGKDCPFQTWKEDIDEVGGR